MLTIVANVHEVIECVVCASSLALVGFAITDFLEKTPFSVRRGAPARWGESRNSM
jgi:hypothetical protein